MMRSRWIIAGLALSLGALGLDRALVDRDVRSSALPLSAASRADQAVRASITLRQASQTSRTPASDRSSKPQTNQTSDSLASADSASRTGEAALSPAARLDSARPDQIRASLERAIEAARRSRPLEVAPEIIEAAAREGRVRVIFETAPGADADGLAARLDSGGRHPSVEGLRVFPLLDHGAAQLSPGALWNLIAETTTRTIELDSPHRASLLESVPQIGADLAHAAAHDGDGFAVAVIDTGVDTDHPMFGARVIEEACFASDGACPNGEDQMWGAGAAAPCVFAGCDHGTHVAGIAVGDAATGPLVGVAPHSELIAINVFSEIDGEPGAYTSDILAAMQHVLALSAFHDIAAVNLSLGGQVFNSRQSCDQASPAQRDAVRRLRDARIATVAASGNDAFTNAIASPACLSNVLGVGSVGNGDAVTPYSNAADFLTLLAPGESIQSAAVGGGTRNGSGTSMATPHVTGAIAAIREALPDSSVAEIENALVLTGQPILDARNGITTPRLRVDQAIAMLEAAGPPSGGDPAGVGAGDGGDPLPSPSSGGGGGGCGLVGIEPFVVLALVRRRRERLRREESEPGPRSR